MVQSAEYERKLLETRKELMEMVRKDLPVFRSTSFLYCTFYLMFLSQHSEQDRHVTQTNMKIDTEVAGLKTMLEAHKLDSIKYLAGKKDHIYSFAS